MKYNMYLDVSFMKESEYIMWLVKIDRKRELINNKTSESIIQKYLYQNKIYEVCK